MIYGTGYPVFAIYDSTNTTLQSSLVGTNSGYITMSESYTLESIATLQNQEWRVNTSPFPPYTRKRKYKGTRFAATLSMQDLEYRDLNFHQFVTRQSNPSKRSDLIKAQYLNQFTADGYKIRMWLRSDLVNYAGTSYGLVGCKISNHIGQKFDDNLTMEIDGDELITENAIIPFDIFGFTKAISLNGTTQYGTFSSFNIGTTHTIEFWIDTSDTAWCLLSASAAGDRIAYVDSGSIGYFHAGGGVSVTHGTFTGGTKTHIVITRSGTSVKFYQNGVQIGTTQTLAANTSVDIAAFGRYNSATTHYISGKVSPIRIYKSRVLSDSEVRTQYNSGYGANYFPPPYGTTLANHLEAMFIFDETGGTSTTETDQSGNGRTMTLINGPTRVAW